MGMCSELVKSFDCALKCCFVATEQVYHIDNPRAETQLLAVTHEALHSVRKALAPLSSSKIGKCSAVTLSCFTLHGKADSD